MLKKLALDDQSEISNNFEWEMLLKNKYKDQNRSRKVLF